jgi:tetratricopeptide repeat protein 21B
LDGKLKESRKQADEKALVYAGYFWYIIERPDKAREYADRAVKMNDSYAPGLALKGWIEAIVDPKTASGYFEKALKYVFQII